VPAEGGCASNGGYFNIGSVEKNADDASMSYVDLWASNAYEWNFGTFFSEYRKKSAKPIVITEFGIDAWNAITKIESESPQAQFVCGLNFLVSSYKISRKDAETLRIFKIIFAALRLGERKNFYQKSVA